MIQIFADTATGGWIAGNIIIGVWLVLCGIWLIAFWLLDEWPVGLGGFLIGVVCGLGIYIWASWPFAYEYHHWIDKEGTVSRIEKRLVPNGDSGMQEKVVVQMQGDEGVYGINETRATLLKNGDRVHFKCKKAYDFGVPRSAHGWDCKWVDGNISQDHGF